MQGLRPWTPRDAGAGRPVPLRHLAARPQPAARAGRRDPAPSRLAYRLQRMWLTPIWRKFFRVGLPAALGCMIVGLWLSDPDRRASLTGRIDGAVDRIQHRDEFMVRAMRIDGASEAVDRAMRAMLPAALPASSFDLDLDELRARILKLDAVRSVELRIMPDGILSAVVTERQPAMLWRHAKGVEILDETGHRVASASGREARPDLPLIAGEGADAAAAEALALIDAAGPILPRLRGLQRIGERRWDVALDRGQRILLPAEGPLPALERALAMQNGAGLLDRDVAMVDLRDPGRTVLRLGPTAHNAVRRAQGQPELGADGKPLPEEDDDDSAATAKPRPIAVKAAPAKAAPAKAAHAKAASKPKTAKPVKAKPSTKPTPSGASPAKRSKTGAKPTA